MILKEKYQARQGSVLCATFVSFVSRWWMTLLRESTTEQRTRRLPKEIHGHKGQSPNQRHSPTLSGERTARQSRRLTSGGTAVLKQAHLRRRLKTTHLRRALNSQSYLVLLLLTVLLGAMAIAAARTSAQSEPQEVPGQTEFNKGDYDTAIRLVSAHLTSNTNDAAAERLLLRSYTDTGRYVEAEAAAKKFLLKNAGAGIVRHQLAEVLMLTGRYAEAVTEYEKALNDSAKSKTAADGLETQLRLAETLDTIGQNDRANRGALPAPPRRASPSRDVDLRGRNSCQQIGRR